MRVLIVKDDIQLRRIENALAEIEARPAGARDRLTQLVAALENERSEILSSTRISSRGH